MVSLHSEQAEQEAQVYLVPKIARISAQYWWDAVSLLTDHFFESSSKFRASMSSDQMADLVLRLEDIRRTVSTIDCPSLASEARQELMDAMSSTLLAISGGIRNHPQTTTQHTANAREHLERFGMLLDELGLS